MSKAAKEDDPLIMNKPCRGEDKTPPAFLDPDYWHPKCSNFEIIDWAKWDSVIQKPPEIYDPPQFKVYANDNRFRYVNWFGNRSPLFKICCLPQCIQTCFSNKKKTSRITDDSFFEEFLDPNTRSPVVPDLMKGAFWLKDNVIAPENLVSFERYAWKPNKEFGSGPLGLGTAEFDWTCEKTTWGTILSSLHDGLYSLVQIHPEGKWISLAVFTDPKNAEAKVNWLWIYVIQEGDVFKTPNGEKLKLNPGDFMRLSWGEAEPYSCAPENLGYQYTPVRVARMSDDGKLQKVQPHFDELRRQATESVPKQPTCCGHCVFNMSPDEILAMQRGEVTDKQVWAAAPKPPSPQSLDRL